MMLDRLCIILTEKSSSPFAKRSAIYLLTNMLVHPGSASDLPSVISLKTTMTTQVGLAQALWDGDLPVNVSLELLQLSAISMWSVSTLFRVGWREKLLDTISAEIVIPFVETLMTFLSHADPVVQSGAAAAISYIVEDHDVLTFCIDNNSHITLLKILDSGPAQEVKQCVCTAIMRMLSLTDGIGVKQFISEGAFMILLRVLAHRHTQDLAQRVYGSLMLVSTHMKTLSADELEGVQILLSRSNSKLLCYAVLTAWHLARSPAVRKYMADGGVVRMIVDIARTRTDSSQEDCRIYRISCNI